MKPDACNQTMTIERLLNNNKMWASNIRKKSPNFFLKLSRLQKPRFLWIGCSDSRVPANEITGLLPGELFVHRNIANLVYADDPNCLAVLQYAIEILKIKHIIVCGHYDCGGVKAVLESNEFGETATWLRSIRNNVAHNSEVLRKIKKEPDRIDRLCELNVLQQSQNLFKINCVLNALKNGRLKSVHAWIYNLRDGLVKELDRYTEASIPQENFHKSR